MRAVYAAAVAAALAAPACAQILGVEELPTTTGTGGHSSTSTGTGGSMEAGPPDAGADGDGWSPGPCDCLSTQDWAKTFSVSGDITVAGVAVDSTGRIVVAGSVSGSIDIGGDMLPASADPDVLVVVLDSCGERIWARRFGGAGRQTALALALEPPGSPTPDVIVLSGAFTGELDFGGVTSPLTAPNERAFIARLDPTSGDGLASFAVGSDASMKYQGTAVAVAADGSVYWAGTEDSGASLFLRRLDAKLTVTSQITPSCADCDPVLGLAPNTAILAGRLQGSVDFAPGGPGPITSNGSTDAYAVTLVPQSAAFVEDKSKVFGDVAAQLAAGVAGDAANGDVFLAGAFGGTLNMGGGGKTKVSTGGLDAFVAKLAPDLSPQWLAAFGGGGLTADQRAVAVTKGKRVAVAGDFVEALDTGADAGATLTSAGDIDAFLLILNPASGAVLHADSFGGKGADHAAGVALDDSSHAVVAGVLAEAGGFGCGVIGGPGKSMFVTRRTIP